MTALSERVAALPAAGGLWRGPVGYCLRVYVVARLALSALCVFAAALLPAQQSTGVPGWDAVVAVPGWSNAVTGLERADALWYLRIAATGYRPDDVSGAFFPLYPGLSRAVGLLTGGHGLLAALLVGNAALVVALVLLHRLTALELGEAAARRVVVGAVVLPTSFFLFAPYTEALFLALVLGVLLAARRDRWALAALLAALTALARSNGVLLAAVLAVEAVLQVRGSGAPVRGLLRRAPAVAAGPLALAGWLAAWKIGAGDGLRPLHLQSSGWLKEPSWPWQTLLDGLRVGLGDPGGYLMVDLVAVVLALLACGWLVARARPTYAAYALLSVVFPLLYQWPPRPFLSMPRYLVVVFPLLWAADRLGERYGAHAALAAVSAGSCALLAALFVQSYPIF